MTRRNGSKPSTSRAPRFLIAELDLLLRAYDYAGDAATDRWDFAIEISDLREAGLTATDLRWLVAKGFAEHAEETSNYGDPRRSFRPGQGLTFLEKSCFVLTERGEALARRLVTSRDHRHPVGSNGSSNGHAKMQAAAGVPRWDHASRELTVAGRTVKRFRVPAPNQELILASFQEEGWPEWIDDPLPVSSEISPNRRLQNVINSLNRNQSHTLIRFHGNGNGNAISWELMAAEESK